MPRTYDTDLNRVFRLCMASPSNVLPLLISAIFQAVPLWILPAVNRELASEHSMTTTLFLPTSYLIDWSR